MRCLPGLLLALLLLTSCGQSGPAPTNLDANAESVTTDSDEAHVVEVLAGLDPCALLEPLADRAPAELLALSPHTCRAGEGSGRVEVDLLRGFGPGQSEDTRSVTIDDVTAYRRVVAEQCRVWLPVSERYAVRFTAGSKSCRPLDSPVADAIARLRTQPATVIRTDEVGRMTACALVAAALDAPETADPAGPIAWESLDACTPDDQPELVLDHGEFSPGADEIANRPVVIKQDDDDFCAITWRHGGVPSTAAAPDPVVVTATASSWNGCAGPRELAERMLTAADGPAPPAAPSPDDVRSLL